MYNIGNKIIFTIKEKKMETYVEVSVAVVGFETADVVRTSEYNSQIPGTVLPDQEF